jgi:hypothetical protein
MSRSALSRNLYKSFFRIGSISLKVVEANVEPHFTSEPALAASITRTASHRFEGVLDCIERESYSLRARYPELKNPGRGVAMMSWALWMALKYRRPAAVSSTLPVR